MPLKQPKKRWVKPANTNVTPWQDTTRLKLCASWNVLYILKTRINNASVAACPWMGLNLWEYQTEWIFQIWCQSDQQFTCKCGETAWTIRSQGTAAIQCYSSLKSPIMNTPSKFEVNVISSLPTNVWKPVTDGQIGRTHRQTNGIILWSPPTLLAGDNAHSPYCPAERACCRQSLLGLLSLYSVM